VYASVSGVCGGVNNSGYVVNGCLKHGLAALAASLACLGSSRRRALVRLLRLEDNLLQTVTLLVGATVLHLRHRLLHVSEPRIRHFVLTAGNESGLA
jgi:hypothetical protein